MRKAKVCARFGSLLMAAYFSVRRVALETTSSPAIFSISPESDSLPKEKGVGETNGSIVGRGDRFSSYFWVAKQASMNLRSRLSCGGMNTVCEENGKQQDFYGQRNEQTQSRRREEL